MITMLIECSDGDEAAKIGAALATVAKTQLVLPTLPKPVEIQSAPAPLPKGLRGHTRRQANAALAAVANFPWLTAKELKDEAGVQNMAAVLATLWDEGRVIRRGYPFLYAMPGTPPPATAIKP